MTAGHPARIRDIKKDLVELMVAGNFVVLMPEFMEAGESSTVSSRLYGADMLMDTLALPFGFNFTVMGLTVYASQGISLGRSGPKHLYGVRNMDTVLACEVRVRFCSQ